MGAFIGRNLKYQLTVYAKAFAVTAVVLAALILYWNALTPTGGGEAGYSLYPFLIPILVPLAQCYQNSALYLNLALGFCATRKTAFITAQLSKLIASVAFSALGMLMNGLSFLLLGSDFIFEWPMFAIVIILTFFAASLGEVLGHLTHRFGKIGAIIFGITCGAFGGAIGFFFSMMAMDDTVFFFSANPLYVLSVWVYLLIVSLGIGFTALTYFCFIRRYVVK